MVFTTSSSSSSNTSFYIVLPSNTNVEGNRTNSFRVHLPRKLQFGSQWCVGLAVLVYPHSWPSLGTTEQQFVHVHWHTGQQLDIPVPAAHVKSPPELAEWLRIALGEGSDELSKRLILAKQKRAMANTNAEKKAQEHHKQMMEQQQQQQQVQASSMAKTNETTTTTIEDVETMEITEEELAARQEASARSYARLLDKYQALELEGVLSVEERQLLEACAQLGVDAWVHAYERPELLCKFHYDSGLQRFRLKMDTNFVRAVHLTDQLAYILGFVDAQLPEAHTTARYMPDMTGGVASFYVYAPDLIEPVIIGNVAAPVLRIVNLRGRADDDIIEECYVAIQYHRLIMKEVSDIQIEIRTPTGALMPFQYGVCTLTLHFKKIPYF